MQRLCIFSTIAYFPSILYFCCFVSFRFFFLTFDIFSGTHVRPCVQVATPLESMYVNVMHKFAQCVILRKNYKYSSF